MDINQLVKNLSDLVWGWPLLMFVVGAAVFTTFFLNFVQIRYFFQAWKSVLLPDRSAKLVGEMTPFQAFVNAISASVGNGSIAGMATAVAAGGPGAAFWVFVFGLFGMALRFSEVFLATNYPAASATVLGGPLLYLTKVPGRKFLPAFYAFFALWLGLATGNAMQANSIRIGLARITGLQPLVIACILLAFICYVILGGARRIVRVNEYIVPIKIGLFFSTSIIAIVYHHQMIGHALNLIMVGAFNPAAIMGAGAGIALQQTMRLGIVRGINASEAGIGTAAIFFGSTGVREPVKNGSMSMIGSFLTANLVCFFITLIIVASGAWNNGQTSLDLTITAYESVFGTFGGWIVTFLSISFGMGTLVAYAYLSRACWLYLSNGRFENIFKVVYCVATFAGALAAVEVVWNLTDIANAGMLVANLFGILWLLPSIRKVVVAKS
jgi:alanine or glycine:cation symporter, AGCS family